ncbi:14543_t:CDS:1, partial [Funneliformis geosporum]
FSEILLLTALFTVNALPHPGYPIAERSEGNPKDPNNQYQIASYPIAERSESNPKDPNNPSS